MIARLAAACLLPSFTGREAPDWVRRHLDGGLGGVCLYASNIVDAEQLAGLTAELRRDRPDVVIALDEEGGDVTRLEWQAGCSYPGNLALGAVDDPELTRAVARAMADDLRAVGVTMNLAPVADVNTNPQNPVIGVRAFGSDPELVARHVAASVKGTQSGGVLACAKHFPGHGDTHVDSHEALPVVGGRGELEPFRAAIDAGVAAIMPGHLVVPALAPVAATVSGAVITGLLRGELHFDGIVVTDALDMGAVARSAPLEETGVLALAAGADLLCLGPQYGEDAVAALHVAIVAAVDAGRLSEERLAEAAARVARAAPHTPAGAVNGHPGRDAAARALRVSGAVRVEGPPRVVELVPEPLVCAGEAHHSLGSAVLALRPDADVMQVDRAGQLRVPEDGRPLVLVLRDPGRHAWQRAVAESVVTAHPGVVVVDIGVPGWLPTGTTASVTTHGAGRANLEAAAALLVG